MKHTFFIFLLFACLFNSLAQDCSNGLFPYKNETSWELVTYGRKNQSLGKTLCKLNLISTTDSSYIGEVQNIIFDEKGKQLIGYTVPITCTNGTVHIDTKSILPEKGHVYYESLGMVITNNVPLVFPPDLKIGQILPNGKMDAEMYNKTSKIQVFYQATDRKVLAKESITVPAGTFECYKIETQLHEISIVAGITLKYHFRNIEWYAPGIGIVKSESYDKYGDFACHSELSKISN